MARGRGVLRKRGDQFLYAELLERGAEINRRQVAMTISRRIKFGIAYLSQFRLFMQPLHAFGREDVLKLRIIETTELAHLAFKNAAITGRLHQRSEEHTSELQSLMRISYAVFCLQKKKKHP